MQQRQTRPEQRPAARPPAELLAFVAQLPERAEQATEKRTTNRFRFIAPVQALPLNDDNTPSGEPFVAVSTDISTGGIGLMHLRMVTAQRLFLQISRPGGEAMRVIAKVVRCRPFGGYAALGCEFIQRL